MGTSSAFGIPPSPGQPLDYKGRSGELRVTPAGLVTWNGSAWVPYTLPASATPATPAASSITATATVTTAEPVTATSYGDLATAGPSVTVPMLAGQAALVTVSAVTFTGSAVVHFGMMSFAASGPSAIAAADVNGMMVKYTAADSDVTCSRQTLLPAVTANGDYTFTAKYRSNDGTSSFFYNRRITVQVVNPAPAPTPPPPPPPDIPPPPSGTVFAASSFWYADISAAPLASNSAALVSDAVRQMKQYYGSSSRTNIGINTTAYAAPVYVVDGSEPKVTFGYNNTDNVDPNQQWIKDFLAQFVNVPVPSYAQPADGSDMEMVIWDKTHDTMWETWLTLQNPWRLNWGGKMTGVSTSDGIFKNNYGTTATSLPFLGGQISMAEMAAAIAGTANAIPHAIGIAFVETAAGHTWPAQRDDGGYGNSPIQEGMRFRINPSVNIAALGLNPVAKAVALAGQKYGFVVWDKAGAVSIRCENPKSRTAVGQPDPYPGWWSACGVPDYSVLDNVPWSSMQALQPNYGQP